MEVSVSRLSERERDRDGREEAKKQRQAERRGYGLKKQSREENHAALRREFKNWFN